MKKKVLAVVIPVMAAGGVGAYFALRSDQAKTKATETAKVPAVVTASPSVRDLPLKLSYPAEIQAIQQADIRPVEAKGFIRKITVDKGDRVKKGQLLVTVDCPEYRSRVGQIKQEINQMKALLDISETTVKRLRPLVAKRYVSQLEFDNAEANYLAAKARNLNAHAKLTELQDLIRYCEIRSPFTGEVTTRHRDPGHQVRPGGGPILTIMRLDVMRVFVNVVERDVRFMRLGVPVQLTVEGIPYRTFEGKVTRYVKALDPRTRTLLTEIEIPSSDGVLKPGMFGQVSLLVKVKPQAIIVPATAVLAQEYLAYVYIVEENKAKRLEVKLGQDLGKEIEIARGLRGNEQVIVEGRDLVGDGTPVRIARKRSTRRATRRTRRRRRFSSRAWV